MTRAEALEIAKANQKAYHAADWANMRNGGNGLDPATALHDYGYRHGWFRVGEFNFDDAEITGIPYDSNQSGWAYL